MADEPENHTLRLLREMREENLRLHAGTREQLAGVREENLRLHAEARADTEQRFAVMREENLRMHTETREQLTLVLQTVVEMAKTVNAAAEAVTEMNGRMEIIEGLNIVDGRLARIEKHTGLVKA